MAEMMQVAKWYDLESNQWFLVFKMDEKRFREYEEETKELEKNGEIKEEEW